MTAPPNAASPSPRFTWTAAIFASALGATILYSASPGINWPIWVATASVCLVLSRLMAARRIEPPLVVLVSWATLLSVGFALTDNDFFHFLIIISDAMLLGLATVTLGVERWSELSAKLLAVVPVLAPLRVVSATAFEATDASRSISSPRARSILKGSLLSAPLVVVLIALLGSADPVIKWGTERISGWLPDWSFPPRVLFFALLLTLTLGANSIASRQLVANVPQLARLPRAATLGLTEQRMMLWSTAVVLWLFVLLQASYLVHPPPSVIGTGVTFAEFARRGFGELSLAATLVGAIIIVLEYTRPPDVTAKDRIILRRLELALVVALELVLASAFRRVILYEQAYGFTGARVYAQAYMVVMALALAALALEIVRGEISAAFGRRVAEIALAAFTILVFWNHEAWIVDRNIDRAVVTGKFDTRYATHVLSGDAIPTLVRRRAELPGLERDSLELRIACVKTAAPRRWFEWNRSVSAAESALRPWHNQPCPLPRSHATQ